MSDHTNDHFTVICDRLIPLKSWTNEQKAYLLDIIIEWTSKYEYSSPIQLENNMRHLRQLLTSNILIVPLLSIEAIFQILQSTEIPAEAWHDYLLNALDMQMNGKKIALDFTPVILPTIDSTSDRLINSTLSNENIIDRSSLTNMDFIDPYLSFRPSLTTMTNSSTFLPRRREEPMEEYQKLLQENLQELYQLKWDRLSVERLERLFNRSEIKTNLSSIKIALLVVETIVINQISSRLHIEKILNAFQRIPVKKWMDELNEIVNEQGKVKTIEILLQELGQENSQLTLVNLKEKFQKIIFFYEKETSKMSVNDISTCHKYQDELYKIAVVIQGVYLFKQVRPRDIQILSLLLLIENQQKNKGRLAQICTGEGKSIIISMLAVYLSLTPLFKRVDIITTSDILAQRDAEEFESFYKIFNLAVGHNCCDSNIIPNYNVHIMYGTVNHFAGDLLRSTFYLQTEIRSERPYDAVIVDEVDSMFIDHCQDSTQLASLIPGYKSLNVILRFIYIFFCKYNITLDDEFIIRSATGVDLVNIQDFISAKLNDRNLIQFPEYRRAYIMNKLPIWIQSAKRAMYELNENVDYVISKTGEIIVVDYMNTGVSHANMNWSNGIQQFLQLKHQLRLTPERSCDSFYSNVTLFKKYQLLYGLTGTLGGKDSQEFIRNVYSIDIVIIPKYMDNKFEIYPHQFAFDRQSWLEKIRVECHTIAKTERRAVLIICQTISNALDIQSSLRSQYSNLKLYLRSDEHTKPEEVHQGTIIIATNLAGRGTDLKIMTSVVDQGGLHVIVTFMPHNSRVQQQAFGRAGRQGQPGSARLIVYEKSDTITLNSIDEHQLIEFWQQKRDEREKEIMNGAIAEVQRIEAKDRFLIRFLDIVHSQKDILPFTDDVFKPGFDSLRESWGVFCDDDSSISEQRFLKFADSIRQKIANASGIMTQSKLQPKLQPMPLFYGGFLPFAQLTDLETTADAKCEALGQLITHPKYLLHAACQMIIMKDVVKGEIRALSLYEKALQYDDQDFITHYNSVICYIKNDQNSINQAKQALSKAITLLNIEIERRTLLQVHSDSSINQNDQTIAKSNIAELVYLGHVLSVFKSSQEQLDQFNEDEHEISCSCQSWKSTLTQYKNTQFEGILSAIEAEHVEWVFEGLIWFYEFKFQAKQCWWKTILVFVIGLAQVVGGAFACYVGHWKLGTTMFLNGVMDIYRAVATRITNDFDLLEYFGKKILNYGLELLCITPALSNLTKSVISVENLRIVGMGIDSARQLYTNGINFESIKQLALNAMNVANMNGEFINSVKQISERYKDIEVIISGDFEKILQRGVSTGVNHFISMLEKDSLFDGNTEKVFKILKKHAPAVIKYAYNGNNQQLMSHAFEHMNEILNELPVAELLPMIVPKALTSIIDKEKLEISDLYKSTIKKFEFITEELTSEKCELIKDILSSPDMSTLFDKYQHKLGKRICQTLLPYIERNKQFDDAYQRLELLFQTGVDYSQMLNNVKVTFNTIQNQQYHLKGIIERQCQNNPFLKQAMLESIDGLCRNPSTRSRSLEATNALKEYLGKYIIQPMVENGSEIQMDDKGKELINKFVKASKHIQEQKK